MGLRGAKRWTAMTLRQTRGTVSPRCLTHSSPQRLSAPGSTCHHDEGQGLGACIQEVNKVPESPPHPLSHCWSRHSQRVPSCSLSRTPWSLSHPFQAPGAGGTTGPATSTVLWWHKGPPSPTTGHCTGTARSWDCWLLGWGWVQGHRDGSWVLVTRQDWGDRGCAPTTSLSKHGLGSH